MTAKRSIDSHPRISPSGLHHACEDHKHKESWLESIGKAIMAPIEGAQGRFTAAHPQPDRLQTARPTQSDARPVLLDRRDPRTVRGNGDGVLKALGKAIVAPIAGAYEEAAHSLAPPSGRARQE